MGKATGFITIAREKPHMRPVAERLRDWREIPLPVSGSVLQEQGARCMDCGVPYCHSGCPVGNVIPDWNDLVYRDRWQHAYERLARTNNFPEFTGRLCPAPCESSCVLAIGHEPVTIKAIEHAIIERAFAEGWITARPPATRTNRRVAIIGSGPAGLAAADQLDRAGHTVTVFERADRIGGLLRYGIPEFKMEKRVLDRRLAIMQAEGVTFVTGADVGVTLPIEQLRLEYDAIVLAGGASAPRDLAVPGRELSGIHFAMDYLTQQNRLLAGDALDAAELISAQGKRVAIIGGGDTGADCLGTALRQHAHSVHQIELQPRPPVERAASNPWPQWPHIFRVSSAHEEGGEREFAIATQGFSGDDHGRVAALHAIDTQTGEARAWECDLVLLALGFTGPTQTGLLTSLGTRLTERGTVWRDERWMTSVPGVFVAGDMQRGQSLIVWAIADGRQAAASVDQYLTA